MDLANWSNLTKYREVPLLQQNIELNEKTIDVTCGGYSTMLVDLKTSELSGGFVFDGSYAGRQLGARFIFWRTLQETMYLFETFLHRNDLCHRVKITFKESPILSVDIVSNGQKAFFILVSTTTSFHRIPIKCPSIASSDVQDPVLLQLNEAIITDPMNCYIFINDIGQSPTLRGSAIHCEGNSYSTFAIATDRSLHLCVMGLGGDKPEVKFTNVEYHTPLIISDGGSPKPSDQTDEVITMCFGTTSAAEEQPYLFTLHRDGIFRIWLSSGQLLGAESLFKFANGSKADFHSCVLRGSKTLIGLYVSFKKFAEFIVLKPIAKLAPNGGSILSITLQDVCTIEAPTLELIDFQLCELSLWTLWCDSMNNMHTMVCEKLSAPNLGRKNWISVVMSNTSYDDLPKQPDDIDLREFFCKRIFNSGMFSLVAIKKSYMMLIDELTGRDTTPLVGNMLRMKRRVTACIKRQMLKQQRNVQRTGADDKTLRLKMSNQLWENFYQYCVQYSVESSRPVGLLLCERMINGKLHAAVGMVRKQFVSFIRPCESLEAGYYSSEPQAIGKTIEISSDALLLLNYLSKSENSLTKEQKEELDDYILECQLVATAPKTEDDVGIVPESNPELDDDTKNDDVAEAVLEKMLHLSATQNFEIAIKLLRNFKGVKGNLKEAFYEVLDLVTPGPLSPQSASEKGCVSVDTGHHLYSELALATTKQMIAFRYMLLRNLFLIQWLLRSLPSQDSDNTIIEELHIVLPRIENLLYCYNLMMHVSRTRIEYNWSRKRTEINNAFQTNQRNTPLTLLHAYARCRLVYKPRGESWRPGVTSNGPLDAIEDSSALSVNQKANAIIGHLSPMHDDFRFGEWLSENELAIHIDEYVRLVKWCGTNISSKHFIRAKSYLQNGETGKALELFLIARKRVHCERFLLRFLHDNGTVDQRSLSPYHMYSTYFLLIIRLFELFGAYDVVPVLVTNALKHTLDRKQQAIFQNIEFSSYMALGRYAEAYKSLSENVDSARRRDCLRQMVSLLFSKERLDLLTTLPSRGQLVDFIDIVATNARTADSNELYRYEFLYAFLVEREFMLDAAHIAVEMAMRCYTQSKCYRQIDQYCILLLKCLYSLTKIPDWYAWVSSPVIVDVNQPQLDTNLRCKLEVLDKKKLCERFTIGDSVLTLAQSDEDIKLLTLLTPQELITLLLRRKKYNRALHLARCSVPSMVPSIYGHLAKACISVDNAVNGDTDESTIDMNVDTGKNWLHENCLADVPMGTDNASTAWNYLKFLINQEPRKLTVDAHLAVLTSLILCESHVPLWLRTVCFEYAPVQLVRAYWTNGCVEEAYECMLELLKTRLFTASQFCHNVAFPLSLYERMYYELEQSPNETKKMFDKYLRLIEAN